MKQIKIVSWNACLGAFNKLDYIKNIIQAHNPDLMLIQEAEINNKMDMNLLRIRNYDTFLSNNSPKSRLLCYVKTNLRANISTFTNLELLKITCKNYAVFGLYRPFKIPQGYNSHSYMAAIIDSIKGGLEPNKRNIICGDINLDYKMQNTNQYHHSKLYEPWLNFTTMEGFEQHIKTPTWSRIVNEEVKESILDHFYSTRENNVLSTVEDTPMSDHKIIVVTVNKSEDREQNKEKKGTIYVRKWSKYSPEGLKENLRQFNWDKTIKMSVQDHADYLDQNLNLALEVTAPEIKLKSKEKEFNWSIELTKLKRAKDNLWRRFKTSRDVTLLPKIKKLARDYKHKHFELSKSKTRKPLNGDSKSFWKCVNQCLGKSDISPIPIINQGNREIRDDGTKAEIFAEFFRKKVEDLETNIQPEIQTRPEIVIEPSNFLTENMIKRALKEMKPKKCFGFDRMPIIAIKDGYDVIKDSVANLFQKIYRTNYIPNQWKVARIIPIHKKGPKSNVENYRPISNLCSLAKVFEKCILMRINDIETEFDLNFTGSEQYGFKKNSSTTTAMLQIQAKITEALEENKISSLISLDLSAAFDVVDHELLISRMVSTGIPVDITNLVKTWLTEREAYVEVNGETSYFFKVKKGTVQGSILGPVLFAIFVKNVFEIEPVTIYADDNYLVCDGDNINELKTNVERRTENLCNFLSNSGLKVNVSKTEVVIFARTKMKANFNIGGNLIMSKESMRVLGVIFDSKFDWSEHITTVINKANKIQFGLASLKKYFGIEELLGLVTSLGYSTLYYGAPVWLSRNLTDYNLRRLLRCTSGLIKACLQPGDWSRLSFTDLHELAAKPTPTMMSDYCQAMAVKRIMDYSIPSLVWLKLQTNSRHNRRTGSFMFGNGSVTPLGKHNFANRLLHISSKLPVNWETLQISTFKRLIKKQFLVI